MPNGSLSPLGRQLRSVLHQFRAAALVQHGRHSQLHSSRSPMAPGAAIATTSTHEPDTTQKVKVERNLERYTHVEMKRSAKMHQRAGNQKLPDRKELESEVGEMSAGMHGDAVTTPYAPRPVSRARIRRRTRVDRISEALQATGLTHALPYTHLHRTLKTDLSHVRVGSRDAWSQHKASAARHRGDYIPPIATATEPRVSRILASYIYHQHRIKDTGEADWMNRFTLSTADNAILQRNGYTLDDMQVWARILVLRNPLDVATALEQRMMNNGVASVPFFLFSYIVRREAIGAAALSILVNMADKILEHGTTPAAVTTPLTADAVFLIFIRLVRHARRVRPLSLETLAEMLVRHLPRCANADAKSDHLTYKLNKAMQLLASTPSEEPYKNAATQESAVVRILRFMASNEPPIGINSDGYRAVVHVQLALPKTSKERLWAELKALSWPPWKQERTAVDMNVTRESHGISKAAETLLRMREAGHTPREWDMVAGVYTGWDHDQTPTIQTREVLGSFGTRLKNDAALWAARIDSTRTVQEAWACYEAFEEQEQRPSQDVCLAIFRKLHQEEKRKTGRDAKSRKSHDDPITRPVPGDVLEIEPLPPSTHLYTYTSQSPPTVDKLYERLRSNGVDFTGHCLAYLIANATTFRRGLEYVWNSVSTSPSHIVLFAANPSSADLAAMDMPVFSAFIALLSRFSKQSFAAAMPTEVAPPPIRRGHNVSILRGQPLNPDHALVHALVLLRSLEPRYRPAWTSVLRALGRETNSTMMWKVYAHSTTSPADGDEERLRGVIIAHRLMRRVLSMMRALHLDLDADVLMAWCWTVENLAVGCWLMMRDAYNCGHNQSTAFPFLSEATAAISYSSSKRGAGGALRAQFREYVGTADNAVRSDTPAGDEADHIGGMVEHRLVQVPRPALLHTYIRSLGWLADYDGLLETARWMAEFAPELAKKRKLDHNGETMMRRAIVAMRVFCERAWMDEDGFYRRFQSANASIPERVDGGLIRCLTKLGSPAGTAVLEEMRRLIESVDDWRGWPSDEEVQSYCEGERFRRFRE